MGVGKRLHFLQNLITRGSFIAAILTLWLLPGPGQVHAAEATASTESGASNPFTPYGRQHMLLREALARYLALADSEIWVPLDAGQPLAPGMRDPRVKQLRSLLMQYGDYPLNDHTGDSHAADEYDERLRAAVRRFQRRHGLKADALVDNRTRARLNVPPAKVARILAANLKRWRELPKELGPRYILINIPDFSLRLIDGGQEEFRMRVVVGKPEHKTPQLATRMTRLEVNPTWRVPREIALRELLPKGGASLSASGYQLVNQRGRTLPFSRGNIAAIRKGKVMLQQRGGPGNALGRVKFVIPNREAIFLHDTNSKHLFKHSLRAFSHGCIRLEKPLEFARLILAQQNGWSDARIDRILLSNRTRGVALEKPIPVYIAYWTAWVDREGLLQFRPDIYGLDKEETADDDPGRKENRQPE
ncbi:L,D-transpeptidase family protein [Microbulbifer thermotolerans]|uniref:L,D-transpeptidase family protein n=1 Tax=Microbulbifer thermotolerans TaxID=252514 RepID=UPI0009ED0889|nr:L,D-transpeptidase family protein [Microbulbifer thermotolerans]MCX2831301.1 L,D-transpeptidase family protein [Microbulbifer thermotolerans]WKT60161.1 L,D-transpeptidase family protein [Microbulbifer thermotolerans]